MGPLFVAIPIPSIIRAQLQRLCFGLPSVKWIDEESLHLTLLYIGLVEGTLFLDIREKLSEITFPSFSISLDGVDCYHKRSRGEVWVGVHTSGPLQQLHNKLSRLLKEFPIAQEAHPFSPHIILGHYEKISDHRLGAYLEANAAFMTAPFSVESFALLSSEKTERHVHYVEQARFFLVRG
jgi:2'-5' RNA ligase